MLNLVEIKRVSIGSGQPVIKILLLGIMICTSASSMIIRDSSTVVPEPRRCVINDSRNTSGICKPLTACASVLGLLRAGVNPTACSSAGPAFVCCPIEKRISFRKCQEFTKVLTEPIKTKQALVFDGHNSQSRSEDVAINCENFLETYISGGRKANPKEYPYQVGLGYGSSENPDGPDWRCGGTLIDPQFVITAAHCANTAFGPPKVVLLGDINIAIKHDPTRTLLNVSEVYVHPQNKYPLYYNDIAILKLESAVKLSRAILPACLPDPEDRLDRKLGVEATGWGQTGAYEARSDILQSATLKKIDIHDCTAFFESVLTSKDRLPNGILPSQFCAGDKQGLRDTCKGDSGGPVTVEKKNATCVRYLFGITSFGSNFCGYQQPGVYTNILSYLDWIEGIVWYNSTSHFQLGPQVFSPAIHTPTPLGINQTNIVHKTTSSSSPASTPETNRTVIPQSQAPSTNQTVIPQSQAPSTNQTVIPKSQAPSTNQTVIPKSQAPSTNQTVIPQSQAPSTNQTVIPQSQAPSTNQTVIPKSQAPSTNQTVIPKSQAPITNQTYVLTTRPPLIASTTIITQTTPKTESFLITTKVTTSSTVLTSSTTMETSTAFPENWRATTAPSTFPTQTPQIKITPTLPRPSPHFNSNFIIADPFNLSITVNEMWNRISKVP